MAQRLDRPAEQHFIHTGVSWDNFKTIQQGFADSPDIHLFYYAGELEILSTSPEHEIVKGNIGYLIEDYLPSMKGVIRQHCRITPQSSGLTIRFAG